MTTETTYTGIGQGPGLQSHDDTTTGVSGVISADRLIADLRASLAASQAEVKRLKGIIKGAEYGNVEVMGEESWCTCLFCKAEEGKPHYYTCPFYQWEGGEK